MDGCAGVLVVSAGEYELLREKCRCDLEKDGEAFACGESLVLNTGSGSRTREEDV